ncbi:MAG: glycosyltransferase [Lachnospiraceae bacterium]|nr:glycosyltransferase [Lachnospiraceae bacterium]
MSEVKKEYISVIIPVYNVYRYLGICIDSILNQTYDKLEIILVDDGSTDGSGELCDEYADKDSRVIVIHQKNGGISSARNSGLDIASGEFITFVDSDDYLENHTYETLHNLIIDTGADMAYGNIQLVDEDNKLIEKQHIDFEGETAIVYEREFWEYCCTTSGATVVWSKVYKRKIWENIRYPLGKIHEDEAMTSFILRQCNYIACTQKICYNYRMRTNSTMHTKFRIGNLDKSEFYAKRINYFINKGFEEYYMFTFGEGTRILIRGYHELDLKGDENARKRVKELYNEYRILAKKLLPYVKGWKQKLRLRLFRVNLGLYAFVRNMTRDNKL